MNMYGLSETSGFIVMTPDSDSRNDLTGKSKNQSGSRDPVVGKERTNTFPPGESSGCSSEGCGVDSGYVGGKPLPVRCGAPPMVG